MLFLTTQIVYLFSCFISKSQMVNNLDTSKAQNQSQRIRYLQHSSQLILSLHIFCDLFDFVLWKG